MPDTILSLKNINYSLKSGFSLVVPHLEVNKGEIFAIIGPNAAGKTTLLKIIGFLEKPRIGEVTFNHCASGTNMLNLRRRMSFVFQEPLLFKGTVLDNLSLPLRIRHLSGDEIKRRVDESLNLFKIEYLKWRKTLTLSVGEARRLVLARALISDPELLILDEPFSSLDPVYKEGILEDLSRVIRKRNISTIFVTQDKLEAIRFADRIGVLINGRLLQVAGVHEVFNHPINELVAKFVGQENK